MRIFPLLSSSLQLVVTFSNDLLLRLLIYKVFSTGNKIGFIQVIKNSMTLFKIQMAGGMRSRYQIDKLQLFKWISAHNPNEKYIIDKEIV